VVLVVCNCSQELLNKYCSGACFVMVLFSSLASLLKLVIALCLKSRLSKYPTYRLTLLVFVASVPTPCFDPVFFNLNYDERLEHYVPCLGKNLSCWLPCYNLTVIVSRQMLYSIRTLLPRFLRENYLCFLIGHRFLFGCSLCSVEKKVGFTCLFWNL
jgi:hypothetical protein